VRFTSKQVDVEPTTDDDDTNNNMMLSICPCMLIHGPEYMYADAVVVYKRVR
jgi:hypothetical protein